MDSLPLLHLKISNTGVGLGMVCDRIPSGDQSLATSNWVLIIGEKRRPLEVAEALAGIQLKD